MFYLKKNVTGWERVARVIGGGTLAAAGWLLYEGMSAGYILIAIGAMSLVTGMMGFCPACAMVGRRHES